MKSQQHRGNMKREVERVKEKTFVPVARQIVKAAILKARAIELKRSPLCPEDLNKWITLTALIIKASRN